ncbi:MAG TPA: 3-oxoacyl-ACP synthase [Cryomorphaceae bacterium]|nr:3-oxoacyl-ACP synthase [Owenweeksia sp.]MBF98593.1 3-oxoacyl-ACP synthase [Owenweeksia sp.]HAD98503.1 3-oxoacyl-ACP synthase [Cryomorphaceae bacterium]HBF18667.1 3-oxoacyl-ACP synthase [Cryomorphaceae bacterium]
MMAVKAAITSVGGYIPEYRLTNQILETMVDTTDEWITSRTGIKERRILKEEGAGTSFMGIKAVEELLTKRGIEGSEIDLLICSTTTPDMPVASTAAYIATKIGATNAFSFDLQSACSGFLYGLVTGSQFIETGKYKKVVVVGGDKMSSIIDYTDRTTCVIFGDGAGAVLLEPNEEGYGLQDSILKSDGAGREFLYIKSGGSMRPPSHETVENREHFVHQEGQQVFKFAVNNMAEVSARIMDRNNLRSDDIAYLVPHQANKRIIDATANRMGIGPEKVMLNIHRYGNTTNGTLPLCLWDYEKNLRKGDNLVFSAFGGGFTWGSAYLVWAYDPS